MVLLDTFNDNLCLWRCIAIHYGARTDRSTVVARDLVKSFLKLRTTPTDIERTSLDELDNAEQVNMLRHVFKEEQLLIVQMSVLKPHRQITREVSTQRSAHAWLIRVGMRHGKDIRHAVCSH